MAIQETLNTGLNIQPEAEADAVLQRRKYIGMNVLRTEDPAFLTGRGKYTDDVHLTGMLHAAFLRSAQPHARIVSIDKTRALALDGVIDVITGEDLEDTVGPFSTTVHRPEVETVTRAILNSKVALYVGQPLAIVVAESRYLAEDGVDALDVEYEVLEPVMDAEKALEEGSPLLYPEMGTNNFAHIEFQRGDVDECFERADHVFKKRFHAGRFMAAPLEARGVIADWDASGELTVWSSSQVPNLVRTYTAGPLGIAESKMRVISEGVGGGFGMKAHIFDEEVLIPAASQRVGAPVKWIEDRYENLAASLHSKEVIVYLEMAVQDDGTFLAFKGHYIGVGGAWPAHPWTSLIDPLPAASLLPSFYDIEAVGWSIDAPMTNRCPLGAYRGVGWTPGHSARETMIDDIARELGIDPLEIRLKNMIPDGEEFVTVTGMKYDGGSYSASMLKVKEMIDYDGLRQKQAELREEGRYIGIGWSPWVEPCAWGSEVAKANGFAAEFFDAASVTIEPDGSVTVTTGCHNHGQAHYTTLAQVTADTLGVPFESIRVIENDSATAVYGTGTYASRTAVVAGGAIMRAGSEVRDKIIRLAAHAMEVSPEDIELAEGKASVKGVPDKVMTMQEIGMLAYYGGPNRIPDTEPTLTATRSYDPPETYSNGTIVAIVEVDVETGKVHLQHIAACEDCGTMLNPMVIDGQMHGAIAQGIGGGMYEDLAYDASGQFLASSLMDYLYPSTTEVPNIEIAHIETPSTVTEGGIKGMGESGTIASPVACLNAIADAISPFGDIKIMKSPIGPNDIREMLRAAAAGSNGSAPATQPADVETRLSQQAEGA
jgi:carbon-monoxide dehydrogenase large subunit